MPDCRGRVDRIACAHILLRCTRASFRRRSGSARRSPDAALMHGGHGRACVRVRSRGRSPRPRRRAGAPTHRPCGSSFAARRCPYMPLHNLCAGDIGAAAGASTATAVLIPADAQRARTGEASSASARAWEAGWRWRPSALCHGVHRERLRDMRRRKWRFARVFSVLGVLASLAVGWLACAARGTTRKCGACSE